MHAGRKVREYKKIVVTFSKSLHCVGVAKIFDAGCAHRRAVILRFAILKGVGSGDGVFV